MPVKIRFNFSLLPIRLFLFLDTRQYYANNKMSVNLILKCHTF
jgi:hypothetical protein